MLAFAAFAAATAGGFRVGVAFAVGGVPAGLAGASVGLGWFMLAATVLTVLCAAAVPLRPVLGLAERGIYRGMLGWLVVAAVGLPVHALLATVTLPR